MDIGKSGVSFGLAAALMLTTAVAKADNLDGLQSMADNPAAAEVGFTGGNPTRSSVVGAGISAPNAAARAKLALNRLSASTAGAKHSRSNYNDPCGWNGGGPCLPKFLDPLRHRREDSIWKRGGKCLLNLAALPVTILGGMYAGARFANSLMMDSWLQITPVGIAMDVFGAAVGALAGAGLGVWGFLTGGLRTPD